MVKDVDARVKPGHDEGGCFDQAVSAARGAAASGALSSRTSSRTDERAARRRRWSTRRRAGLRGWGAGEWACAHAYHGPARRASGEPRRACFASLAGESEPAECGSASPLAKRNTPAAPAFYPQGRMPHEDAMRTLMLALLASFAIAVPTAAQGPVRSDTVAGM